MTQVHLNLPFLTIHWDEEVYCVWMEWKRFVKGDEFREGLDAGLELLKRKGSHRWLADLRHLSVVDMEDQDWAVVDWFPRAVKAGIRRMAIVWPRRAIARMSVEDIMRKADHPGMTVEFFEEMAPAREWLVLFPPPPDTRGQPQLS